MKKEYVDARGQECPMPLVMLKNAMEEADGGDQVTIDFTCPQATTNLPDYCQANHISVEAFCREENYWRLVVRKPDGTNSKV